MRVDKYGRIDTNSKEFKEYQREFKEKALKDPYLKNLMDSNPAKDPIKKWDFDEYPEIELDEILTRLGGKTMKGTKFLEGAPVEEDEDDNGDIPLSVLLLSLFFSAGFGILLGLLWR